MTTRFGLDETVIKRICDVFARHPEVEKAIIYGSRARGTHACSSDIDLTLTGDERLTFVALTMIMDELDDLLLPSMIDLSTLSHISDPDVFDHIRHVRSRVLQARSDRIAHTLMRVAPDLRAWYTFASSMDASCRRSL